MTDLPSQAKAWQFRSVEGGLENHLELNTVDLPKPKPNQHLIKVHACSINPVDYKISEAPVVGSIAAPRPATPGIDVAGEIVRPAAGSKLKVGTMIVGLSGGPLAAGKALAEYTVVAMDKAVAVPSGVSAAEACALPVAGVTAYQSLAPHVKSGDHVLFNGGSGGVGTFAIQIAKTLGCHVTTTCSGRNVDLCKSLGADEVVDYTKGDIVEALSSLPYKFDHIVDGVGNDRRLYWQMHQYTNPEAIMVNIVFSPSLKEFGFMFRAAALPSFLGGGKRKITTLTSVLTEVELQQTVAWMAEKKIKTVFDSRYPMSEAAEAFKKQKTGRARGKIVIDVI